MTSVIPVTPPMRPEQQTRSLTQGERELIAVALEDYAMNCSGAIERLLVNVSDETESFDDRFPDELMKALKRLVDEVDNLKRFRRRASNLAHFVRRNQVDVRCWITIPEQL